jgi:hypothetical protein
MDEWMHAGQDGKTETKVGRKDGITIVPADYQVDERFPWPRLGQEVHPFCGPHVSEEGEEGGAEGEGTIIWLLDKGRAGSYKPAAKNHHTPVASQEWLSMSQSWVTVVSAVGGVLTATSPKAG